MLCPACDDIYMSSLIENVSKWLQGCDASVMLMSTDTNQAEKDAQENLSLSGDGFDAITQAKLAVEEVCPGVVSCADLITLVTRDLIILVRTCAFAFSSVVLSSSMTHQNGQPVHQWALILQEFSIPSHTVELPPFTLDPRLLLL